MAIKYFLGVIGGLFTICAIVYLLRKDIINKNIEDFRIIAEKLNFDKNRSSYEIAFDIVRKTTTITNYISKYYLKRFDSYIEKSNNEPYLDKSNNEYIFIDDLRFFILLLYCESLAIKHDSHDVAYEMIKKAREYKIINNIIYNGEMERLKDFERM